MLVTDHTEQVTENMNLSHTTAVHSILAIWGMACLKCAATIHDSLLRVDGVLTARVDFPNGLAHVTYDASRVDPLALILAVANAGSDGPYGFRAELVF